MTDRFTLLAQALLPELNALGEGWCLAADGLDGPGSLAVHITALHSPENVAHVDVGFCINKDHPEPRTLWDCAVGWGDNDASRMQIAAKLWTSTTLPAIAELVWSQRGEYASHVHSGDEGGLAGFHVIHGPIMAYGHGPTSQALQSWLLDHPVLPKLATALSADLQKGSPLRSIKVFVASNGVAELRLDGQVHGPASDALAAMEWPRAEAFAAARIYVLVLHPE